MTRLTRFLFACTAPLALILAGCGGSNYNSNPSNGTFSISPSSSSTDNGSSTPPVKFIATLSNGMPATGVNWVVVSSQNDTRLGTGSIDATGRYYPPTAISKDSIQEKVQANLTGNVYQTASAVVTVTAGFLQNVTPENGTLASGSTLPLTVYLGEVGGGSVNWSLSTSASGGSSAGSGGGAISNTKCQTQGFGSSNGAAYTQCSATYTAPSSVSSTTPVYAIAAVAANSATTSYAKLLLNNSGINTSPLQNQATQTGAVQMGSSGGNNNDVDIDPTSGSVIDCASGTLGALVKDQANSLYILSNNHVLAESDQGSVGDTIIQPGLVDTGCTQLATGVTGINAIGTLQYWVPLIDASANVDAALAATTSGAVDASGAIVSLGASGGGTNPIASAAPVAGAGETLNSGNLNNIHVAKSGRTTGLTCTTVDAIDTTLQVSYYKDAAETQFYYQKTYTNQIGMPGNYFSDSGDSGSLVVDASNAQAVGLFYAAGIPADASGTIESFANPIGDVLTDLAQHAGVPSGTSFSMVGGSPHTVNCLNYDANSASAGQAVVSAARMNSAEAVASQKGAALIDAAKGILGVAAGKSLDQPGQAAVLVYVDRERNGGVAVPQTIGGLPTRVIATTASAVASGSVSIPSTNNLGIHLPQATLDAARSSQKQYVGQLMSDPAFFGVGVTQSQDNPSEAALVVFIDKTKTPRAQPATVGGLRVRYRMMNPIRVNATARALRPGAPPER